MFCRPFILGLGSGAAATLRLIVNVVIDDLECGRSATLKVLT